VLIGKLQKRRNDHTSSRTIKNVDGRTRDPGLKLKQRQRNVLCVILIRKKKSISTRETRKKPKTKTTQSYPIENPNFAIACRTGNAMVVKVQQNSLVF
jgi:hypothetical protein